MLNISLNFVLNSYIIKKYNEILYLTNCAGKLLAALVSGLTDRNTAIRKTYSSTVGHVARSAKDSSIDKLLEKLRSVYLEKEGIFISLLFFNCRYLYV